MNRRENNPDESMRRKRPPAKGASPRVSSREGSRRNKGSFGASDYSRESAADRLKAKRRSDVKAHDNKIIFIGAAVFVGIILVVSLVMSWNLWWRYDDAADIQGTWTVEGSSNKVKITDSALYLTDTLFYDYTLDTENKRITFTFEDKKGEGAYSFSDDRNTLTIAEENTSTSDNTDPSIYTTLVRSDSDGS